MAPPRETFSTRFGLLMTMIGVAVGLGNVWRFPYMVGKFGGAPFVSVYVLAVLLLGIPTLIAEWTLGRYTRRGVVGAFERAGLPFGRQIGWFFFCAVAAATAYYMNALGWVLYHAVGELWGMLGGSINASAILPPADGLSGKSLVLQVTCTAATIGACALVLIRGLRRGIERMSRWIMPALLGSLLLLLLRALTLPNAWSGVRWYILKFEPEALTPGVVAAAVGQAFFSLSLGGTFMVVYGSYLAADEKLPGNAAGTALGDLSAGLLAGLAIVPVVVALGYEPASGPGLIFSTLPNVFAEIPLGRLFGFVFFASLFAAAYLSAVAAFEVLVAGLTDNTRVGRTTAVRWVAGGVFLLALPSMVNMKIFVPWDLIFGSGMQALGAFLAVVAVTWAMPRADTLAQMAGPRPVTVPIRVLYLWMRFVVPGAILAVGLVWLLSEVLGLVGSP